MTRQTRLAAAFVATLAGAAPAAAAQTFNMAGNWNFNGATVTLPPTVNLGTQTMTQFVAGIVAAQPVLGGLLTVATPVAGGPAYLFFANPPAADPKIKGVVYSDGGILAVSAGP